jgi:Ca-activated chloride channel homolog
MVHYAEWVTLSGGRHRGPGLLSTGGRAIFVTLVLVAGVGALVVWQSVGKNASCSGEVRLSVAAAPEISPAVQQTANTWAATAHAPGGQCVAVDVAPVNSAEVASAIAANGGVTLTGLTVNPSPGPSAQPAAATVVPDVWVPDSSSWLVRVRAAGPNLVPPQAPSIARSPVVLAMPEPVAATLGWPNTPLTWGALLQRMTTGQPLKVGIVEPNRDAVGLAGLVSLGNAAAGAGASAEQATIAAMRALVLGRASAYSDLLAHFPKTADAAAIGNSLMAAPISEQALIAFNGGNPPVKLAGFYVDPAPPALDYPYAVMPGISADKTGLAEDLRQALAGDPYQDLLARAGLRDQDGAGSGRDFPILPGAPTTVPAGQLDGATVAKALTTWISVTRPARMLAVIDISGSMALPVPTAGGASRGQVAIAAAQQGMALFDDSWAVGLWTFSTQLEGNNDYRQLVPIGKMSAQRAQLQQALAGVTPIPNGQTGLYDTVLAAYKAVQTGWDGNSVNSVVLLTDGQNQDPSGITLDQLVEQLKATMDPRQPIQVIAIGIGDEVSEAELTRITSTTGGGTFIARDPSAIGPIFLRALSLRPPVPTT